jgi:hypothetical protein
MLRCVQCGTDLVAPVRSEYWSDNHACHIWHCPKCCACFSSLVCFSDDTDTEPLRRYSFRLCATDQGAWQYSPQSAAPSSLLSNLAADPASARPRIKPFLAEPTQYR